MQIDITLTIRTETATKLQVKQMLLVYMQNNKYPVKNALINLIQ